uniref:Vesicle associated membrane protein 1 n=1 Tax=Sus scrofa TaxID=9823 RepID=A0A8D1BGR1_PIG
MSAPAQPPTEGAEGAAPGGGPPGPPPNTTSNRRLQQTQAQVEEVVDIIRVNVDKVLERDQKLSELDDRADALQAGASQFESSAAKLKRKYWWKNCKMMIMLGVICAIIVVVIVIQDFLCRQGSHNLLSYPPEKWRTRMDNETPGPSFPSQKQFYKLAAGRGSSPQFPQHCLFVRVANTVI